MAPKPINWNRYKNTIDWFATQANNVNIIWHRYVKQLDRYGEGLVDSYIDVELPVLISYNYVRTWPIAKNTETGQIDSENCEMYLNKQQLADLGYLNESGYFNFNPDMDRFTLNGIDYRAQGDTEASQAGSTELFQLVILLRIPKSSGTPDVDPTINNEPIESGK